MMRYQAFLSVYDRRIERESRPLDNYKLLLFCENSLPQLL